MTTEKSLFDDEDEGKITVWGSVTGVIDYSFLGIGKTITV